MPAPFRFDRRWRFDVPVERLWEVLADTGSYGRWWWWLLSYEPVPLEAGAVARFRVRGPLPYRLSFSARVDEVIEKDSVRASISGDLAGPASLEVSATVDGGSEARLAWELCAKRPLLVRTARVARPAMVWGHDLVVAAGVRQFRRKAL
jgi:uncharacterized protein YndB with AHSA1/START domain